MVHNVPVSRYLLSLLSAAAAAEQSVVVTESCMAYVMGHMAKKATIMSVTHARSRCVVPKVCNMGKLDILTQV